MTLNPAQEAIVALLGKGADRPEVAPSIAADLSSALVEELTPYQSLWADGPKVWVSKHGLASIHSCETHAVQEWDRDFEWTPAAARGVVAHKAVELMIHWQGEAPPATMVDEAIARLIQGERGVGGYLDGLAPGERAELRSFAVTRVSTFDEAFPPLQARWRPVTESPARVELFGGNVVLAAKTDLTLGRPGDKVIIDLKSGTTLGSHREDLRFYALIETLKLGVAPRKIATYYLDTARAHAEDVTEGLLWSAMRRTVDGVVRIAELQRKVRPPEVRPGPTCRWCPLNTTCAPGVELLARLDDPDVVSPW